MAIADFIPTIWAARFVEKLYYTRVYGTSANRNYEMNAMDGNKIEVPTWDKSVTVRDYTVNTDIAAPEIGDGDKLSLNLDQQKYFNIYVDDIHMTQSRPDIMNRFMEEAAIDVAQTQDAYLRGVYEGAFNNSRRINSANAANASNADILNSVIALKAAMSNANIPLNDRWLVVPPSFVSRMEQHFIAQGGSAAGVFAPATADMTVSNGFAGMLLGFELRVTTQIPTNGNGAQQKYRMVASQGTEGVTMAEQITQMEAFRPERRFGDAVKGLYVYGALAAAPDRVFYLEVDNFDVSS